MNLYKVFSWILDSRQSRETITAWCKKVGKDADKVIEYVESTYEDTRSQLATARWICAGYEPKFFNQALYICEQKKLDPMHQNPEDLVKQNPEVKPKEKPINPDTVLTDRQEDGEGNVTYAARDKDRAILREIINTHYGKDSSPWCLLQGDNGKLTEESNRYWRSYNAYPKRVAFRDGKLLAFSAGQNDYREWWDRFDRSFPFIPYDGKSWEGSQGWYTIKNGEVYLEKETGYRARLSNSYSEDIEDAYVALDVDGDEITFGGNTYQIAKEDNKYYYVDGNGAKFKVLKDTLKVDGLYESYHANGQLREKCIYKNGERNGLYESYHENGQLREKCIYKNGERNGLYESYNENGQLRTRCEYKNGILNGLWESYFRNGQLQVKCTYKDDERNGLYVRYYDNGQLQVKCTYKDDEFDGLYERYYDNGQLREKCTYKDDEFDGLYERYSDNGALLEKLIFKDGVAVEDLK